MVNFDSFCQHLNQSLGFERAGSYKHGERVNPFYTPRFGTLTFDILTRETVFLEVGRVVGGLRYLKRCSQELTFSLPAVFRSLAFSLLARSFRSPELTESQAQIFMGTPHDNLTECYLCHAIGIALVDIAFTQSCHWLNYFKWPICSLSFNAFNVCC